MKKELKTADKLFALKEERIVYLNFNKFDTEEPNEASILCLIRLDVISTDPIDLVKQFILEQKMIGENQQTTFVYCVCRKNKIFDERKTICCSRRRIPCESA